MPQARNEQNSCRRAQNQHKLASFSESIGNHATTHESRKKSSEKKSKKKSFVLVKFKGLGCKGTSSPTSTSAIVRPAAECETKRTRNQKQRTKRPSNNRRNPTTVAVVVDVVPDVCCTPPGIGISSDFAPVNKKAAPRLDHRKHPRESRKNISDSHFDFPAISSRVVTSRTNNRRSAGETIEMMMLQQTLLPGRIIQRNDRYRAWRRNIDDMSYEELLDLSEEIGYVGTGLQEEEISKCTRKFKMHNPLMTGHKDWKCCICQENGRRNDDTVTMDCGHHHHLQCIKQWLTQKNECPVCKSAVILDKSR